jgi:hypothetical protein
MRAKRAIHVSQKRDTSRAARPDPSLREKRLLRMTNVHLFEDAVVQLFAAPVGCGLDEGEHNGMRLLGG